MSDLLPPLIDSKSNSVVSSAFCAARSTLKQELLIAIRNRSGFVDPLVFFVMVIALFPLGVSPSPQQLLVLAPGLLWVVALLASLMATQILFKRDFDDGSLELLLVSSQPVYVLVMAKVFAHWLVSGLPLTLMAPVLSVMVHLPESGLMALCLSLLIGTFCLSIVGAIGAGLTVGLKQSGVLLALIVLPLYTPILIFGASAVQSAVEGAAYHSQLAILGAYALFALVTAPFAIVSSLKINVSG